MRVAVSATLPFHHHLARTSPQRPLYLLHFARACILNPITTSRYFYSNMSTSEDIQRLFLSAPTYALVGASKDPSKYGNKVPLFVRSSWRIHS